MRGWTLVFDLDGTLVDTAPDLAAATNHVLSTIGLNAVDERSIRPIVAHGALAMVKHAAEAQGRLLSERELYDLFEVFIHHYAANLSLSSRPYPDVITALDGFRAAGATLAVCTNKLEAHARALLGDLAMTDYFAAITGRDSIGAYKPDARHYTGTVALAGGTVERSIMIGDSETDIATARAAGVPVVAVTFGYSTTPVANYAPDRLICLQPLPSSAGVTSIRQNAAFA
jgi:phosphoglycolate phosphatase